jgi:hypothetical protein
MSDDNKVTFSAFAQDSMTVKHLEEALTSESLTTSHFERSLTTSHLQQRLDNAAPVQPQGTSSQPSAATSQSPIQTDQKK